MIPFTDETGLRDYRADVRPTPTPWPRWPWLILAAFAAGVLIGLQR